MSKHTAVKEADMLYKNARLFSGFRIWDISAVGEN